MKGAKLGINTFQDFVLFYFRFSEILKYLNDGFLNFKTRISIEKDEFLV